MAISLPDIITHGNPNLPIVDGANVTGGLKQTGVFSNSGLSASFSYQTDKFKLGTILMVTSSNTMYYLTTLDPTLTTSWTLFTGGATGPAGATGSQGPIGATGPVSPALNLYLYNNFI